MNSTEGLPSSGTASINGDTFTWLSIGSGNTLTGVPSSGANSLNDHDSGSYVAYENTYDIGQVWYTTYSNIQTALTSSDFTVPSGSTINYVDLRYGRIILDAAISTSSTVSCDTSYSFKTLQCVDKETEALTKRGWKKYNELTLTDELLTLNSNTGLSEWNKISKINVDENYVGKMTYLKNKTFNALVTSKHKWATSTNYRLFQSKKYYPYELKYTKDFTDNDYILTGKSQVYKDSWYNAVDVWRR